MRLKRNVVSPILADILNRNFCQATKKIIETVMMLYTNNAN